MTLPYITFAFNLWRIRERKGITSTQLATHLNISRQEYRKYESGECRPSMALLISISRFLEIDLARFNRWLAAGEAKHQPEKEEAKSQTAYLNFLEEAIQHVAENYQNKTGKELNTKQWQLLKGNLKRDLQKVFNLPSLPMNIILILNALAEAREKKINYLNEVSDFILENESLAGFICRDMYFGPFIYYAANLILFKNNPCDNMRDCFNRLTIKEFEELLWLAVSSETPVYPSDQDIPDLQLLHDFHGLGCLMVEELKPHLPPNVNQNHLYQAVLLQGIGIHALYSLLLPSSFKNQKANEEEGCESYYAGLNSELLEAIIYELHPVVSAMVGARWNFPAETLQAVLTHHHQPTKEVTPLCATIKIINTYVNADFPSLSQDDINGLLAAYPQVTLSADVVGRVAIKLEKLKNKLYERTSSMLEKTNHEVVDYTSGRIKKMGQKSKLSFPESAVYLPPKRSDFRLDSGFQATLQSIAHDQHLTFLNRMTKLRKGESLGKYEQRLGDFQLRLAYLDSKNLLAVAEKCKISQAEVEARLFGEK